MIITRVVCFELSSTLTAIDEHDHPTCFLSKSDFMQCHPRKEFIELTLCVLKWARCHAGVLVQYRPV